MDIISTKRQMILNAFKWRDDMKNKQHNEMCDNALMVFMYIIILSHLNYMYNNYKN